MSLLLRQKHGTDDHDKRAVMKKITIHKIKSHINWKTVEWLDDHYDQKVAGQSLTKTVPSICQDLKNGIGMTNSQPTHYLILQKVFKHVALTEEDVFIDVGCGKGRVLAFLLKQHCPCSIYGVELSEVPGRIAAEWTKKYDRVHVILDDAFRINYDPFTVLFLSRPFLPKTFQEFIGLMESQLTHSVTFIYIVDQESGHFLRNRPGWTMKYREKYFKIHGLRVALSPQWFSIWEYHPEERVRVQQTDL